MAPETHAVTEGDGVQRRGWKWRGERGEGCISKCYELGVFSQVEEQRGAINFRDRVSPLEGIEEEEEEEEEVLLTRRIPGADNSLSGGASRRIALRDDEL